MPAVDGPAGGPHAHPASQPSQSSRRSSRSLRPHTSQKVGSSSSSLALAFSTGTWRQKARLLTWQVAPTHLPSRAESVVGPEQLPQLLKVPTCPAGRPRGSELIRIQGFSCFGIILRLFIRKKKRIQPKTKWCPCEGPAQSKQCRQQGPGAGGARPMPRAPARTGRQPSGSRY